MFKTPKGAAMTCRDTKDTVVVIASAIVALAVAGIIRLIL